MSCQGNDELNHVLIQISRSFLQYVSESSPWVRNDAAGLSTQLEAIAARQRQDAQEIFLTLNNREFAVDAGSFPTEYTDQQFLGLDVLIGRLQKSQSHILAAIVAASDRLQRLGDTEGASVLATVEHHEQDIAKALQEIADDLKKSRNG